MNHYTHLYGSIVINASCIGSMVNFMLEAHVRYLLYIIIYCKRVHNSADLLVWGSLRLAPIAELQYADFYLHTPPIHHTKLYEYYSMDTDAHTHTHIYTRVHTHTHAHPPMHTHACTRARTRTRTHTHTQTHTLHNYDM